MTIFRCSAPYDIRASFFYKCRLEIEHARPWGGILRGSAALNLVLAKYG